MSELVDLGHHASSRRPVLPPAWLWLLCWLTLGAVPIAAAPLDTHQLLRFQEVVYEFSEEPSYDREVVIYRDGQVTLRLEQSRTVRYRHLHAPQAILERLRLALATERVGLLQADGCQITESDLPTSFSRLAAITWFGKGRRMVRLDVNHAPFDLCSESVQRLFDEVIAVARALYRAAPADGLEAPGGAVSWPLPEAEGQAPDSE